MCKSVMQRLLYPTQEKPVPQGGIEGFSQYFGAFNAQVDFVMLDGGKGRLRNAGECSQLVLT